MQQILINTFVLIWLSLISSQLYAVTELNFDHHQYVKLDGEWDFYPNIADYRAATEAARASLTAHSGTEQNHRRVRELQQQTTEALQPVERERKRADQYHQATTESEVIRGFIARLGEQLKIAITEPFRAISDWGKSKERDQRTIANDDLYRNRETDSTINPTASKETRLGEQLSRKISGFSSDPIFKALDEIDRRRELQLEQQRKNDRSYSLRF